MFHVFMTKTLLYRQRKQTLISNDQQYQQKTIISDLKSLNIINQKENMTYAVINPAHGLEKAQKCGSIKPVNGISICCH